MHYLIIGAAISLIMYSCNLQEGASKKEENGFKSSKKPTISQSNESRARLSPLTKSLILEINSGKEISAEIIEIYSLVMKGKEYYARGLVKVNELVNESEIQSWNIVIKIKVNNIWTIESPIKALEELGKAKGVEYVEIDERLNMK